MNPSEIQTAYYSSTASFYEKTHVNEYDEHGFALAWLSALIAYYKYTSILDVGSGTGRAIKYLQNLHPSLHIVGIEPSPELRDQGYLSGVPHNSLISGDALSLQYSDNSFDLVCAFGVLHHVQSSSRVISEMIRVSRSGLFLSDSNCYGQGDLIARSAKLALRRMNLWKAYKFIATRGRGYHYSEGDGLFYSYSLFDDLKLIKSTSDSVHFLNTITSSSWNLRFSSPHICLFSRLNKKSCQTG